MSASPTSYPFRQALTYLLQSQITTYALPAINAKFALMPISNGSVEGSTAWPALQATDVIIGDLYAVGSNAITICVKQTKIVSGGFRLYVMKLWTDIGVKCVSIGQDSPQEFELFGTVIIDNLTDLLTSLATYELPAQRADDTWMLPEGAFFTKMSIGDVMKVPSPMKSAEGVVRVPSWTLTHTALMTYYLDRNDPAPIGG